MYHLTDLRRGAGISAGAPDDEYLFPLPAGGKYRINILAPGDVGSILLTGLVLLGGDIVSGIGIFDIKRDNLIRCEAEMNQIAYASGLAEYPRVTMLEDEGELFACDVFVFCASKGVPAINSGVSDVRMAQFAENKKIVEHYAELAALKSFNGVFGVVSDPVDPLCKSAYTASGLKPGQFRGFGLGVMNGRALYYARKEKKFSRFIDEGRVFGPHGEGLVVADSVLNYDDGISVELTEKVTAENIRIRRTGFKPFIAPAISSGALSILAMLRGQWHYSSNYIGSGPDGAFLGALNRVAGRKTEIEDAPLAPELFDRIKLAYENLKKIG